MKRINRVISVTSSKSSDNELKEKDILTATHDGTDENTIDVNDVLRKAEAQGKNDVECLMEVLEASDVQMISVMDDSKYHCHICYKSYKTSRTLQQHLVIHSGKEAEYVCKVCGKAFHFASNLRCHELVHTETRSYKCNQCDETFNLFNELRLHKDETHNTVGDILCPKCPKKFFTKTQFNNHMRQHEDKPVKCEVCNKGFSQQHNLVVHMRTHTGEKPFKCDTCDKSFAQAATLYYHKRIHTGERPYKCRYCGDAFYQVTRLRTHITKKHGATNDVLLPTTPPEKIRIISIEKTPPPPPVVLTIAESPSLDDTNKDDESDVENEILNLPKSKTKMEFINPEESDDSLEWETRNNPEIDTESDDSIDDEDDVELDVNNLFDVYFVYKCKLCSAKLRKIKSIERHIIMHKNENIADN